MNITTSTVTKLTITDVPRLDPVEVLMEDTGPSAGQVIVKCWNESWTAGWGGMSGRTVAQFIAEAGTDYVVNCLSRGIASTINDYGEALVTAAKAEVIKRRREGELNSHAARDLFGRCDFLSEETQGDLYAIFGDDYWNILPTEPNPKYEYLWRIVETVQAALKSQQVMA